MKPLFHEAHYNLGGVLRRSEKFAAAELSHKEAINIKPIISKLANALGDLVQELGRLSEAKSIHKEVVIINQIITKTAIFFFGVKTDLGEMVQAVFNYRNALLIEPQFYDCYHNLGLTLKELSRFEEAADSIDKATHLEPSFTKLPRSLHSITKIKAK